MTYRLFTFWLALFCCLTMFSQFGNPFSIENTDPQGSADYIGKLDLENDGDLDLVTVEQIQDWPPRSIIVLFETTAPGTQAEAVVIDTVSMHFNRFIIADIDGDGYEDFVIPDLRTVNFTVGMTHIGWKRNNGDGTMGMLQSILISTSNLGPIFDIEAVDLDDDGDLDLAYCGFNGALWIRNEGSAGFSDPMVIADANTIVGHIRSSDINNDGLQDIVYAYLDAVLYIPAVAPGIFGIPQSLPMQWSPVTARGLAIGDLNNDGNQDLVVCAGSANRIMISMGDGAGLGQLINWSVGTSAIGARFVEIADMDNDGLNDVVITFNGDGRIEWRQNTGLNFVRHTIWEHGNPATGLSATKLSFILIDDDGDGLMDIISNTGERITAHRNDGASFETFRFISTRIEGYGLEVYDIDDDGDNDLVISDLVSMFIYRNDGSGNFGGQEMVRNIRGGQDFSFADLDMDGLMDVVFAHSWDWEIAWYRGLGDGLFGEKQILGSFASRATSVAVGDFDNDGDVDIVGAIYGIGVLDVNLLWYENLGNGVFAAASTIAAGSPFAELMTADMNGDQLIDIVGTSLTGRVSYYPNLGNGVFGEKISIVAYSGPGASSPVFYDIGDVDGDGDLDVVAFASDTSVKLARNNGSGGFSVVNMPTSTTGGIPKFVYLNDDDLLDIVLGSGHISLNQAGVPGPWEEAFNPVITHNSRLLWCGDIDGDGASDIIFPGLAYGTYVDANRWWDLYWLKSYYQSEFAISGTVFGDTNGDGIRQANEFGLPWVQVSMTPDLYGVFSETDGTYSAQVVADTYNLNCMAPSALWSVTNVPAQLEATVSDSAMSSTGNDFGLMALVDTSIVTPSIVYSGGVCSGTGSFWISYANSGTRVEYGTVTLQLDTLFTFDSSTPPPFNVSGSTISWVMDSLPLFGVGSIQVSVGIPSAANIGATLYSTVSVETAPNDVFGTEHSITVACSYDPNDKQVSPNGYGAYGAVDIVTDHLDYTVRFQNTGNAPAIDVVIQDQLTASLDRTNIQVLGFSHTPTHLGISPLGELTIRFDGIMLPDSGSSFPDSQGFIKFRIALNEGLPHLEAINNTARIYFDLNSPIITNTVLNTLVDCELWEPQVFVTGPDLLAATEGDTYQWYLDGLPVMSGTEQTLELASMGTYVCEVTSIYGCVAMSEEYVVISTGFTETSGSVLLVAPNPFEETIRVVSHMELTPEHVVCIIDAQGRELRKTHGNGSRELVIDRRELAAGIYVLQVMHKGTTLAQLRIVAN